MTTYEKRTRLVGRYHGHGDHDPFLAPADGGYPSERSALWDLLPHEACYPDDVGFPSEGTFEIVVRFTPLEGAPPSPPLPPAPDTEI